jgi:hypothetical protein
VVVNSFHVCCVFYLYLSISSQPVITQSDVEESASEPDRSRRREKGNDMFSLAVAITYSAAIIHLYLQSSTLLLCTASLGVRTVDRDDLSSDYDDDDSVWDETWKPPSVPQSDDESDGGDMFDHASVAASTAAIRPPPPPPPRQPSTKSGSRLLPAGMLPLPAQRSTGFGKPRQMTVKHGMVVGGRRQQKVCPVDGCGQLKTDMRQHLKHVHRELTVEEVNVLMAALPRASRRRLATTTRAGHDRKLLAEEEMTASNDPDDERNEEQPPPAAARSRPPTRRRCSHCGTVVARLGIHVRRIHGFPTGSAEYARITGCSKAASGETDDDELPAARKVQHGLAHMLDEFERHLMGLSGGSSDATAARKTKANVSRVLYGIMGSDGWHPSIMRRLKKIGDHPNGILIKLLQSRKATSVSVYVVCVTNFVRFLQKRTEFLNGFCRPEDLPSYTSYLAYLQKS